jgi:anti-sigma factor RsiW
MNCADVRHRLAGLLYGDLPPAEAALVETHRASCPTCQKEYAALTHTRRSLDALPAPSVRVDFSRLYAEATRRQVQQVRRWRRATFALVAAAAILLLGLGLKLEIRAEAGQLTVRWGTPSATIQPEPQAPPEVANNIEKPQTPVISAEEIQRMNNLIHALAADVDSRDRRSQKEIAALQMHVDALQTRSLQRDRMMTAFYSLQFVPHDQGEKP